MDSGHWLLSVGNGNDGAALRAFSVTLAEESALYTVALTLIDWPRSSILITTKKWMMSSFSSTASMAVGVRTPANGSNRNNILSSSSIVSNDIAAVLGACIAPFLSSPRKLVGVERVQSVITVGSPTATLNAGNSDLTALGRSAWNKTEIKRVRLEPKAKVSVSVRDISHLEVVVVLAVPPTVRLFAKKVKFLDTGAENASSVQPFSVHADVNPEPPLMFFTSAKPEY